jgi:hypothetical protein
MSVEEAPPSMSTDQRRERGQAVIDRASLRMSAVPLLAGQVLYIVVTQFHTGGEANDHPAIFAAYAGSGSGRPCTSASSCAPQSCSLVSLLCLRRRC